MRKIKLFLASALLVANASCSFWGPDNKLWTCEYEQDGMTFVVKGCDSTDV